MHLREGRGAPCDIRDSCPHEVKHNILLSLSLPPSLPVSLSLCLSVSLSLFFSLSSAAPLGLIDYSQLDMLGVRYQSVNFGAKKRLGITQLVSSNGLRQM